MRRSKKKLTDEQRAYLVRRLACWDTPTEAAEALKTEFGVEVTPQACETYDPTKHAGRNLSKKWRDLHEETRKAFRSQIEDAIPEANKVVRLKHLGWAVKTLKARGNIPAMASILQDIAKEMGNVHTNRREFTGKGGGPIETKDVTDMSDEELDRGIDNLLRRLGVSTESDA